MKHFLLAYLFAVCALVIVIVTGRQGRFRLHIMAFGTMLILLGRAFRFAEELGRSLIFTGAAEFMKNLHFIAVYIVFALLVALIVAGARLYRADSATEAGRRRIHRYLAWGFLGSIGAATALGIAMVNLAVPAGS